jgi:hypothetical protein
VDRVLQMRDGKLAQVISDPAEIARFAGAGHDYESEKPKGILIPQYEMVKLHSNGRVPSLAL